MIASAFPNDSCAAYMPQLIDSLVFNAEPWILVPIILETGHNIAYLDEKTSTLGEIYAIIVDHSYVIF